MVYSIFTTVLKSCRKNVSSTEIAILIFITKNRYVLDKSNLLELRIKRH